MLHPLNCYLTICDVLKNIIFVCCVVFFFLFLQKNNYTYEENSLLLVCVLFAGGYNLYSAQKTDKMFDLSFIEVESLATSESGSDCKWKIIDCPGWWTGDYEACLFNGDGNLCTCGQVTRECPK